MKKMSKALLDRIKFRYDEYYESKSKAKVRENAMKMALNWSHEYPTGTPAEYIRDDIIECWERNAVSDEDNTEDCRMNTNKYVREWRNPEDADLKKTLGDAYTSKEPVHNYVKEGLPKLHGK